MRVVLSHRQRLARLQREMAREKESLEREQEYVFLLSQDICFADDWCDVRQ